MLKFQKRPCKCRSNKGIMYHLYVRERGRFEMVSVFLRCHNFFLLYSSTDKFGSLKHKPLAPSPPTPK